MIHDSTAMIQNRSYAMNDIRQQIVYQPVYYQVHQVEAPVSLTRHSTAKVYSEVPNTESNDTGCCCLSCCKICTGKIIEPVSTNTILSIY